MYPMSNTEKSSSKLYTLAWTAYLSLDEGRPIPAADTMFGCFILSRPKRQTFRFAKKLLKQLDTVEVSFEELQVRLAPAKVLDMANRDADLSGLAQWFAFAASAQRDIELAYCDFQRELSDGAPDKKPSGDTPPEGSEVVRPSRKASRTKSPVRGTTGVAQGGS